MGFFGSERSLLVSKARPTWSWSFASTGKAPPGATYTGNSGNGTRFNSSGVVVASVNNVARFDYDPVTLAPLGYLAEMASTNNLLRSGDLGVTPWAAQAVTVTSNSITAPDGTVAAAKVQESATTNGHEVYQGPITIASGAVVGLSCFFKAGTGRDKFLICLQGASGNWASAVFDLAAVSVSQTAVGATSGTIVSTNIRDVGGGFYRCNMIASVAGANPYMICGIAPAATGNTFSAFGEISYAGNGTNFGYAWGAQLDATGVGVTSYIPTAGATATRAQDVLSLPLTSLPGWNGSQGGVLVAAYRLNTIYPTSTNAQQMIAILSNGTLASNSWFLSANYAPGGTASGASYSAAAPQVNITEAVVAIATRRKYAMGLNPARAYLARDGVGIGGSGGGALPIGMTTLDLGRSTTSALNGTLESIAYYAGARSDAFVQQVSR